jgi:hypothetical protein
MGVRTVTLDVQDPTNADDPQKGALEIRETRKAVSEILFKDHHLGSESGEPSDDDEFSGEHAKITLRRMPVDGDPTDEPLKVFLYAKRVGGVTEFFVMNDDGALFQVSSGGKFHKQNLEDALGGIPVLTATDQSISGQKVFSSVAPASAFDPVAATHLVRYGFLKEYSTGADYAGKGVRLNADGRLSTTFMDIYDSGWHAAALATNYSFTHNLGGVPRIVLGYLSAGAGGGKMTMICGSLGNADMGTNIVEISDSTIKVRTGVNKLASVKYIDNTLWQPTSGFLRVTAMR